MRKKEICAIIFCQILLIILGCSQPEKPIVRENTIQENTWQGTCYRPDIGAPVPALLIATLGEYNMDLWREFSHKIAELGYAVIITNAEYKSSGIDGLASYRAVISDAAKFLCSQSIIKLPILLMGENQAGIACFLTAVDDPSISGVITLGTFFDDFQGEILAALDKHPSIPILIISSMDDPLVPQKSIQTFCDKTKNPEKLVWLATSKHGSEVLGTDMEPIVRRVTAMFLGKYTKK
jgi:hypothetical protein